MVILPSKYDLYNKSYFDCFYLSRGILKPVTHFTFKLYRHRKLLSFPKSALKALYNKVFDTQKALQRRGERKKKKKKSPPPPLPYIMKKSKYY
jgi:hypothetical protein